MADEHKTKKRLLRELKEIRSQNSALERSISGNITERKRLEDLIIDSEERYRRLFETADDG
ncbi:MAG: hypothetical protein ACLFT5_03245, partial [Desulfovermiculus sp.]